MGFGCTNLGPLTVYGDHVEDPEDSLTAVLGSPLSVITGTAALFTDELDELSAEQQRQYLHTITRNAERLAAMAGDLLDLAHLEAGDLGTNPTATDGAC